MLCASCLLAGAVVTNGSANLALTQRKPPHRRYDLSKFIDLHPGGASVLKTVAGQDASKDFHLLHHPRVLEKYRDRLKIGVLAGSSATVVKPTKADGGFGSDIPFAEVGLTRTLAFRSPPCSTSLSSLCCCLLSLRFHLVYQFLE